jgi:hypothetical protein
MTRLGRSVAALAILTSVTISSASTVLHAAHRVSVAQRTGLLLQPILLVTQADAGQRAGLFVHGLAFAQLTLSLTYPGGASSSYRGKTDGRGRYVFTWTVPADLHQSGTARLLLAALRGDQQSTWSGALLVRKAALPSLFVQPLAGHFVAGERVGIFVSTGPGAAFTYRLSAPGGVLIARGAATTDAQGRYVLSAAESYLPRHAVTVLAEITVMGQAGSRTRTARFTLLPRPPLPLTVTVARKAVHAGQPLTVVVSSTPQTEVSLTVALTTTTVARGSGITDATGHWRFATDLNLLLRRAKAARILVRARHGIDRASRHAAFLLLPGVPGILDRLASPSNPAPDLSRFFTQIPDKVILVSAATAGQTLRAYEHGLLVHEDYITTGRPELPTPPGIYHVLAKYTPYEMISPWPPGSPFYYPPSWTHFAMLFREGGYFLHDAPWRAIYGPGTNLPHASDPGEPIGTHGCVNLPYPDMVWLWNWTPVGTTVVVY